MAQFYDVSLLPLYIPLVIFPAGLSVAFVSFAKTRLTLVSGILAMTTAVLWYVTLELVKYNLVNNLQKSGGLIAPQLSSLIENGISTQYGALVEASSGALFVFSFLLTSWKRKTGSSEAGPESSNKIAPSLNITLQEHVPTPIGSTLRFPDRLPCSHS